MSQVIYVTNAKGAIEPPTTSCTNAATERLLVESLLDMPEQCPFGVESHDLCGWAESPNDSPSTLNCTAHSVNNINSKRKIHRRRASNEIVPAPFQYHADTSAYLRDYRTSRISATQRSAFVDRVWKAGNERCQYSLILAGHEMERAGIIERRADAAEHDPHEASIDTFLHIKHMQCCEPREAVGLSRPREKQTARSYERSSHTRRQFAMYGHSPPKLKAACFTAILHPL